MDNKKTAIVKGLIQEHMRARQKNNKGDALFILLHGPPGTGKTLTAESIAEALQVPLSYLRDMQNISVALELSCVWNGILLIDQVDFNLFGTVRHRVQHSQGVVIMTTDKPWPIIPCRINLDIKFEYPDRKQREALWTVFIKKAEPKAHIAAAELEELARHKLNCRKVSRAS
jgi:AAA+ superfamily predicted ATPase